MLGKLLRYVISLSRRIFPPPRWTGWRSIHFRLILIFCLMLAMVVGVGLASLRSLGLVNAAASELRTRWLPSTHALADINNYTTDVPPAVLARARAQSPGERSALGRQILHLDYQIALAQADYCRVRHDPVEAALYSAFAEHWRTYRVSVNNALSGAEASTQAVPEPSALSVYEYGMASNALGSLTMLNADAERKTSDDYALAYAQSQHRIVAMFIAASVLIACAMAYVTRSITVPLANLTRRMRGLITHETDTDIPGIKRNDEIGEMARAMLIFRRNAIELTVSRQTLAKQTAVLREKLSEEQRLTRMQRNFVSMASHEFGTPLAVIENHAQRLCSMNTRVSAADLSARAQKIRNAVRRMLHLIGNLMGSARLLDGRLALAFKPQTVDLANIVRTCGELQKELSASARIEMTVESGPIWITADPELLSQAIDNLFSNALKYSPVGEVITVEAMRGQDEWRVAVGDRGVGVPERDRPFLFDCYYRGSNTANVVGSGVGLYMVKAIAELHCGHIEYEPLVAKGSRFTLRLPVRPPQSA